MARDRQEARKAPRAAHLVGTVTKTKGPMEAKAQAQVIVRAKPDVAKIAKSRGTSE